MRINKYLASCGLASRRASEEIIKSGRVFINGKKVTDLATRVGPFDKVSVDGKEVVVDKAKKYFMINKPVGYTSTVSDPHASKKVTDLVNYKGRLYPVGRLDKDSEGLMILTNDGDYANRIMHPSFGSEKEYLVRVILPKQNQSDVVEKLIRYFKCGTIIDRKKTIPAKIKMVAKDADIGEFKIVLQEGRKRQIRRIFEKERVRVVKLIRIRMGNVELGDLKPGGFKEFTP